MVVEGITAASDTMLRHKIQPKHRSVGVTGSDNMKMIQKESTMSWDRFTE